MLDKHQKEFIKTIDNIAVISAYDRYAVFRDFCEMAAISIANSVCFDQKREDTYMQIIKKYTEISQKMFPRLLVCIIESLELEMKDCLGEIYMSMEIANKRTGQFFTPYALSLTSAKMILSDVGDILEKQDFITVNEPACGSGGMVIAAAQTIKEAGFNYQMSMHVTAQDVDTKCIHMAYIQLSLLHIPAYVILGNTLALEEREVWKTPAHFTTRFWDFLLKRKSNDNDENAVFGQDDSLQA